MEERLETSDIERLNVDTSGGGESGIAVDPSLFSPVDKKKFARPKKYFKVGVGGFLVRQTRQRSVNEKLDGKLFEFFIVLSFRVFISELQEAQDVTAEPVSTEDGRESAAGDAPVSAAFGKPKKRKRQMKKPAKIQLEDNYPVYIQVSFFNNLVGSDEGGYSF